MDIKVTIEAPDLVLAINNLAVAISGASKAPTAEPEKPAKKGKAEKAVPTQEKPTEESPAQQEKPVETPAPEEDILGDSPTEKEKTYTPEEVRAALRALSDEGKQAQMQQIIASFGVAKFSLIPVEKYGEVVALAEKAKNGEAIA